MNSLNRSRSSRKMTLGDWYIRIRDGKRFKLDHLGSWSGKERRPMWIGPQIKFEAEDGEMAEFHDSLSALNAMRKERQEPSNQSSQPEYMI